ncbi:MAG: apolipoprotein N-acyltransferase [Nitrospirales bacterium]|nr:apolipoprotein N-acyltransferase [Nitrospirales bacterium]
MERDDEHTAFSLLPILPHPSLISTLHRYRVSPTVGKMSQRLQYMCGAVLTGLLYGLCLADMGLDAPWSGVAWIALIPLHWVLRNATLRQTFWCGWLAGLVAFVGTMYWVITAMHLYGKVPLSISVCLMLLLAAYLGMYVALYALGVAWMQRQHAHLLFLGAPSLWVALELLRTSFLSGLPWGLFGYSQYQALTIIQFSDITGVYGISFLLVLVNIVLYQIGDWLSVRRRPHSTWPFPWRASLCMLSVLYFVMAYGTWSLGHEDFLAGETKRLRIGLVQANIDQGQKWDQAYRQETLNRYMQFTQETGKENDLIIWPEAATPFLYEQEPAYQALVASLIEKTNTPLLFGSPALRYDPDRHPYLLNSAFLLDRSGEIVGRYDKQHLVPFGEYIPLQWLFSFLDKLVVGIGDFRSGPGPTLLSLPQVAVSPEELSSSESPIRFGVAICFEVIFPDLVRTLANEGANFLVTITNDAWFGRTVAPYQHFAMVVFRAVENRMAFARAANTGISGFVAPDGRISKATSIYTAQSLAGMIPLRSAETFYTQFGNVFAWGCVILAGILLWLARRTGHQDGIVP